jgi:hypothetical protein
MISSSKLLKAEALQGGLHFPPCQQDEQHAAKLRDDDFATQHGLLYRFTGTALHWQAVSLYTFQ